MKLDYATLISPYPLILNKIGSIKSPTLKEIWNPNITYNTYKSYLTLLLTTPQTYCKTINPTKNEWYQSLTDEEKSALTMVHFITEDKGLQEQYRNVLDFFFEENVRWDSNNNCFVVFTTDKIIEHHIEDIKFPWFKRILIKMNLLKSSTPKDIPVEKEQETIVGLIHYGIWNELCDVILQRCGVNRDKSDEKPKFKNKVAERIWLKTQKNQKKETEKHNKNMELPNIISAYAAFGRDVNMTSIWDMTIFQLYDQFQRQQINNYFDISCMSVAAWGDGDNHFDNEQWYKNIHEN